MRRIYFVFLFHGQALVDRLLSKTTDNSLLISRFQESLELEDVRYYVMSSIRENVGKVMDKNKGVGELYFSDTCLCACLLFLIMFILWSEYDLCCKLLACLAPLRLCCPYTRTMCSPSCPTSVCRARSQSSPTSWLNRKVRACFFEVAIINHMPFYNYVYVHKNLTRELRFVFQPSMRTGKLLN